METNREGLCLIKKPSNPPKILAMDLFCGAGGSSWGAHQAGVEIVAAFDLWHVAGLNHSINFPNTKFYHGRIEDVNISQVAKDHGQINLIIASRSEERRVGKEC